MSEPSAGDRIGVVGRRPDVVAAVEEAVGAVETGDAGPVLSTDVVAVVAAGEPALFAVARAGPAVPVLPVDAGRGVRSVAAADARRAVERLVAGDREIRDSPILAATSPTGSARALCDVMLTTREPAHISEFTVRADGERVARFRADGVVVATPAGSHGYARAADGAVVAPGTGVGPVVPVAPFATDQDRWVLPLDDLELVVEREDAPVELLADDRRVGTVDAGEPVAISVDDELPVAVVEESRRFFGDS